MYDLTDIINYYVNLLIIQYHDKPKAKADIELFVRELFADGIIFELQNAFDVDTAVGEQLTILGKYVGIDRVVNGVVPDRSYFNLVDGSITPADNVLGFSDGSNYVFGYFYDSFASKYNLYTLTDSEMRTLIKLKILLNNTSASFKDIKDTVYNSNLNLTVFDSKNMVITYITGLDVLNIVNIAIYYDLLPRPACCNRIVFSLKNPDNIFGFSSYSRFTNNISFSTYSDTKTASFIKYTDII